MNAELVEPSEDEYDEMLNDCYGYFKIGWGEYAASDILKELDPTSYRVGLCDYQSEEQRWACGECGEEYDNKDDAEECCSDEEEYQEEL